MLRKRYGDNIYKVLVFFEECRKCNKRYDIKYIEKRTEVEDKIFRIIG